MSDLIERLRDLQDKLDLDYGIDAITEPTEAADEIERLRTALEKIANHNGNQRLTREAEDMADIAKAALEALAAVEDKK